ncbi:MAG: cobalamin-dependent protein [Bacteroidota bacterium]
MDALHTELSLAVEGQREALARAVVSCQYLHAPDLWHRYGERERKRSIRSADAHLRHLAQSVAVSCPALFRDYVSWSRLNLSSYGVPERDLRSQLDCVREVLHHSLPKRMHPSLRPYLKAARSCLQEPGPDDSCFLTDGSSLAATARQYLDLLLKRDRTSARQLILDTLEQGAQVADVYREIFEPTQREIGRLWQTNQLSIAEEHYTTAVTQFIMAELYPHIVQHARNGHVVVGACLGGDLHEIGLRMVLDFLEMKGWDSHYLGGHLPLDEVIGAVRRHEADLLTVSVTMTYHLDAVTSLIRQLRADPTTAHVRVMVGGRPFNVDPTLWTVVGADGYATDADHAVEVAQSLFHSSSLS